jgi:undecaprenyl-phosphate galactose phosphotransferase/putative colanic acid biosynthesis UDP-glucose lipid carrier transferase
LPIAVRLLPDRQIRTQTAFSEGGPSQLLQIELQRAPLTDGELLAKRIFDVVLSSAALVILAVPMLVVAILVRLGSPGPAIFRQQRIGFNRRPFTIYKFRTMSVQEDGAAVQQARPGDSRVTPIGRILRATSFDELPQLFNVLIGDMSLVGPRPHALVHDQEFEIELAEYAYRRRVKPGITGWAQCKGRRGPTPTADHVRERVELDLWYITNWNLMLDIYIMINTVLVLFRQKNAV